jgi:hypothetical protein
VRSIKNANHEINPSFFTSGIPIEKFPVIRYAIL